MCHGRTALKKRIYSLLFQCVPQLHGKGRCIMTDLERFIAEREAHSVPDNSRFFQYALSCTPEIARPLGSLRSLAAATEFCPLCGQNSLLLIRLVMHTLDCPSARLITQPCGCYRELSALQTIRAFLVRLVVYPGNRPAARFVHVLPRLVPLKRLGGGAGHARLVRDDFCRAVAGEQA